MSAIRTFEELACYQEARAFRKVIYQFCKSLPIEETYRLKDQLIRASRSIPANISEGYGRHHHKENLQFCRQARDSLTEALEHINCALDDGYLGEHEYETLRAQVLHLWKVLNGYIAYLRRCSTDGVPQTNSAGSSIDSIG